MAKGRRSNSKSSSSTALAAAAAPSTSISSHQYQQHQPILNTSSTGSFDGGAGAGTGAGTSTRTSTTGTGTCIGGSTTGAKLTSPIDTSVLAGESQSQSQIQEQSVSLDDWLFLKNGVYYLLFFMVLGFTIGFTMGNAPHVRNNISSTRNSLRSIITGQRMYPSMLRTLAEPVYTFATTFVMHPILKIIDITTDAEGANGGNGRSRDHHFIDGTMSRRMFAVLREAVIREPGGYVHRDLGILMPAPCGSIRGIGMTHNKYYLCQRDCFPPNIGQHNHGPMHTSTTTTDTKHNQTTSRRYRQDEILIRIPLSYQMTRTVAISVLHPLIPQEIQMQTNMMVYDDSMYLTLLLAHERGIGIDSKWAPYIASLPQEPTCGYSRRLRPYMLNSIEAYGIEWDIETNGWGEELYKALIYADRIVDNMKRNFGAFIETPPGISTYDNLQWALCQVVSRGIAGSVQHGTLRLVPVVDLMNHDADAGGIIELDGNEKIENGDFLNALSETDSGTFVIRSMRHGSLRPLRYGQELMVNYNVPYYTPLDWFVYSGFVPPERSRPWFKMDAVIPPVRRDGPFTMDYAGGNIDEHWKRKEERLLQYVRNAEGGL